MFTKQKTPFTILSLNTKTNDKPLVQVQVVWSYIVGRSDDSTSSPGPIYMIGAHIY